MSNDTKKVLVLGGAGSLMGAVAKKYRDQGHYVRSLDRADLIGIDEKIDLAYDTDRLADIMAEGWNLCIQGAATVYGVAGFNNNGANILTNDLTVQINALNLWSAICPGRFVYISSSMVYEKDHAHFHGPSLDRSVIENIFPIPVPMTDYGLSKYTGERLVESYHKDYEMEYTIWRPFNIITPYEQAQPTQGFSHVFADFINSIIIEKQNPLSVFGNGEQVRCFTWIDDVVDAIVKYSDDPKTLNKVFNVGRDEEVSMKKLARMIHDEGIDQGLIDPYSKLAFKHLPAFPNDVEHRVPDVRRMKKELGWEAPTSLVRSVRACVKEAAKHV